MVDASTTCRMNPLSALGIDRASLMRESLHVHGGMVYPPGIRTLPTEKGYVGDRIPDLLYKPDVSLDSRKTANSYVGLYKSSPPGIQKPLILTGTGADALGLDRRVIPADKPPELSLNGGCSYLRVPWMNPYHEAGMYSFLDSSKYTTLNMYKASILSQPPPYLPQHLAYQSLCAGAGGSAAGTERLFYMPPYPPAPISSPLAPPLRIPTATVAPTALSPMMHHQDKTIQSIGPRIHHEPSAFGQQTIHQQTQHHHQSPSDRQHSSSGNSASNSKSIRTPSSKNTSSTSSNVSNSSSIGVSSSSSSIVSVDSCPSLVMQPPRPTPRPSQPPAVPPPPPPPLVDSTMDFQKPLYRSPSSSSSSSPLVAHPVYISSMSKELRSPIRPSSQKSKAKEATMESNRGMGNERKSSSSPVKTSSEKTPQQGPITKDPADKPLDLSAKIMDFEGPTNGYPPKLEALAKLGYSSTARYGLSQNRELLKETLSPSSSTVSTSSKTPERPEIISTLPSSWVVPSPTQTISSEASQNKGSSIIKNKNLEHVVPQSRSSSCPRIDNQNNGSIPNSAPTVMTTASRPSSVSPSPKINGEWPKSVPNPPEKTPTATKPSKTLKKPETPEIGFKPQQSHLENGHAPSHLYMPQGETYLPPSLAYSNRYLSYPVPESLSLSHLQLSGKGPVYPHPVLLSTNSLYSARLPPKPGIPYGIPPSHGEYLTYHDSQEMVHPLMSPHLPLDHKVTERLELRHRPLDKPWHHDEAPYKRQSITDTDPRYKSERESERQVILGSKSQSKPHTVNKEEIVCIDLVQDDTDGSPEPDEHSAVNAKCKEPAKPVGSGTGMGNESGSNSEGKEPELMQILRFGQPAVSWPTDSEWRAEVCSPPRPQKQSDSPVHSQSEESSSEHSPLPDMLEEQTLRCARTSGERARADGAEFKVDRHHANRQYADLGKDVPEDADSHEDEEEGHGLSKSKRSSLAKRIANSSGYVGDRFKCVTTELYADSSKLSREQRALQMEGLSQEDSNLSQPAAFWERAMMRFSELELKEKEGCVSSAAPGLGRERERERELAESQRGAGDWERSQPSSRPSAALSALSDHTEQHNGATPTCANNRVPVLQRCGPPADVPQSRRAEEKRARDVKGEEEGSVGTATGRKRALGLEQSQGHPDCVHTAEERDGERRTRGEDDNGIAAKRARLISDVWPQPSEQEVKNLKVCIELTGLRLSKPRHLHNLQELWDRQGQLNHDRPQFGAPNMGLSPTSKASLPQLQTARREKLDSCPSEVPRVAHGVPAVDRKVKANGFEEKGVKRKAEVEKGWTKDQLEYAESNTAVPVLSHGFCADTMRKFSSSIPSHLSEKRQRLKEHRKSLGSSLPSLDPEGTFPTRLIWHGDPEKPKGKRQCKTKHLGQQERRMLSQSTNEECPELSPAHQHKVVKRSAQKQPATLSDYEISPVKTRPPSPAYQPAAPPTPPCAVPDVPVPPVAPAPPVSVEPPVSRPMPPEARRLIVNKNAGETLLQRAARLGYEEVVLYCLENKVCDVNHRDNAGYCALHEACSRGWLSIVQHLLEHGADINCSAQDGTRPIHDAVENDHLDVVRLLLSYGADPTLATYSGRSLLKMTHSDIMESFLSDYFADLQGREDDDPGVYWEFYGSAVCERADDSSGYDILANPPGPGEDEDEQREVFEFEFSERPLLPCYNIQVSLSQGPRNWLLLSDVLKRLKMSARTFRATFTHIEVVTIAEAEFYKQASLSQLFSCPEELEGFMPDSKELLDLVEIGTELVALLGSSLECLDDRWEPVSRPRS
ncbi:BCL-6 corepressor-like [Sinocyclocheilus rhinocerous]|uniref:BCL-6 corepressor-like n=1 Tax=Sinocyclocheilus rhinocerous TaxID=307959 RepID=UPI0007B7A6DC|nr:PREDICTED: BCL-6 corepressor-like [Sinocyclocheilus rhinocerous]